MSRIILGIDPGSRITGYGIIEIDGQIQRYITSGCIRTQSKAIPGRLHEIHQGLQEILTTHNPTEAAIEQVFVKINVNSALKLGQARGAAIVAIAEKKIPIAEYAARKVKQSIVGTGSASKEQIQHMVRHLLNLNGTPQVDAADALAIALCHAFNNRL